MKKEKILKIAKAILLVLSLVAFVFFIVFFVRGVYNSLFADDIITAQDRTYSSYMFVYMAVSGLCMLVFMFSSLAFKVKVIPEDFIQKIFKKDKLNEEK